MVTKNWVEFFDSEIFYLEEPAKSKKSILLLHGYNWTSDVWLKSETMQTLNKLDFNTFAIDVPTFPKSRSKVLSGAKDDDIIKIIYNFITTIILQKEQLFILGTSASGFLALRFAEKYSDMLSGVIGVVPIDCGRIKLNEIKTRILTIWGSEDSGLKECAPLFKNKADIKIIKNAGHTPYLDQPKEFNTIVSEFLENK